MKKSMIAAFLLSLTLSGCGGLGLGMPGNTSTTGTNNSGNILGDVLGAITNGQTIGNILTSVIGIDKPTKADLIGTWRYYQPGVAFTSENLLAKAGGEVAATTVREKLVTYYNTFGISNTNTVLQFAQDGSFSGMISGKNISGTYTYDEKTCKITMKTLLFSLPAYAKRNPQGISILFESKKLLSIMQTMAAISGNSTLSSIGDISKNYDGIRIGFDMSK